jgi:hypothetical protein
MEHKCKPLYYLIHLVAWTTLDGFFLVKRCTLGLSKARDSPPINLSPFLQQRNYEYPFFSLRSSTLGSMEYVATTSSEPFMIRLMLA